MKESEIRNRDVHNRYLELVKIDADFFFRDHNSFVNIACPACGSKKLKSAFEKEGFVYVECTECDTLFNNPRPDSEGLGKFYGESPSTTYWVNEFFMPMAEIRRDKIFKPRAKYIAEKFPELVNGRIADIGAGFGLFMEELRKLWPCSQISAIEPSVDMAKIIREKGFDVIQKMVEDVSVMEGGFDLLTSFELFEHLYDPGLFLKKAYNLLRPGGYLYITTLNGWGFDIQLFWEKSKSISPPHHLNFFNPESARIILEKYDFEIEEISTPGELDWDIVEGAFKHENYDPGRFFRTVAIHTGDNVKKEFQSWLKAGRLSSHMRIVARRK